MSEKTKDGRHAFDCTIHSSPTNCRPYDGICTCGYGLQRLREGDNSYMVSGELDALLFRKKVFAEILKEMGGL